MKNLKVLILVGLIAVFILLLLPIAFYANSFGIGIWNSHKNWGVMGSAIGGIYTAIFAFLTLLVLICQSLFYFWSHRYTMDMGYIRDNRSDFNELFDKLDSGLSENDSTVRIQLLEMIESIPEEDLLNPENFQVIRNFNSKYPHIIPIWVALQPILTALSHHKRFPYLHSFEAVRLKTASILTFRVCVALDKVLYGLKGIELNRCHYWQPQT
ncbi:MAG: hypothetical protein JKY55_12420 [Aliivibrio sp.]|uniref:hypothetical protein n=1 Tax=Aliivibrio sp. TaxID=1872443 RepID=UPI001A49D93C|nr:hypothetical protein [Aliivibrio sp.]